MDFPAYTDKYFTRTKKILRAVRMNQIVSMGVFTRGHGIIRNIDKAAKFILEHAPGAEVWMTSKTEYSDMEPLMVIRDRVQEIIELETLYLGIMSHELSIANGHHPPSSVEFRKKFSDLQKIYRDIPMTYFGARHYHYKFDKTLAGAALEGGAVQTSTDIGSGNIGLPGAGTMPHLLPLLLAEKYGIENATLKSTQLFDKHIEHDVPRITLVDTFGREITDSLAVAKYYGKQKNMVRIDTCSENVGEGSTATQSGYVTGAGVTIELVNNVRQKLDAAGYNQCGIFLSGGFGDEQKARAFMKANDQYRARTNNNLFLGVGIGEATHGVFCTADCYEVNKKKITKTGRCYNIDYSSMARFK